MIWRESPSHVEVLYSEELQYDVGIVPPTAGPPTLATVPYVLGPDEFLIPTVLSLQPPGTRVVAAPCRGTTNGLLVAAFNFTAAPINIGLIIFGIAIWQRNVV